MRNASVPITLIVVGVAWLLWYFRLFPDIDWVIAAGLVGGGIAIFVVDRITKTSVVTGTSTMCASPGQQARRSVHGGAVAATSPSPPFSSHR